MPQIKMMIYTVLICSMCPAATSVPSLACVFDKDTSYASLIVSVTSLLCMISLPAFVALAEFFIK
jgi:predicted permease